MYINILSDKSWMTWAPVLTKPNYAIHFFQYKKCNSFQSLLFQWFSFQFLYRDSLIFIADIVCVTRYLFYLLTCLFGLFSGFFNDCEGTHCKISHLLRSWLIPHQMMKGGGGESSSPVFLLDLRLSLQLLHLSIDDFGGGNFGDWRCWLKILGSSWGNLFQYPYFFW